MEKEPASAILLLEDASPKPPEKVNEKDKLSSFNTSFGDDDLHLIVERRHNSTSLGEYPL